jgi:predicted nuclease of restriction endonuclease-like (RecB) superfamily
MSKNLPAPASPQGLPAGFFALLEDVKARIRGAQTRAVLAVNAEMVRLYWDIGRLIDERQQREGWGAAVIPRLSRELRNELPEVKGFSERNIKRMLAFHRAYADMPGIVPQPVAQMGRAKKVPQPVASTAGIAGALSPASDSLLWLVPWGHHALLLEKVKLPAHRLWYMQQTLTNGWSRNVLALAIDGRAHERQGKAITNFAGLLPGPQSDLALQTLKDPYLFDFLTLEEPFHERELEAGLVQHLEKFLLELGQGFAFVGRQYRLDVGDEDFYIDLLFYHLRLRSFVVIDLKTGPFKPEYAGKLNFYCNVVNDQLRHPTDQPTVGLILCQTKDQVLAEYALSGIDKPIGVSSYELTRALPANLKSALPTVEQIEAELATTGSTQQATANALPKKEPKTRRKKDAKKKRKPPHSGEEA